MKRKILLRWEKLTILRGQILRRVESRNAWTLEFRLSSVKSRKALKSSLFITPKLSPYSMLNFMTGMLFICVGNLINSKWNACLMEVAMNSMSAMSNVCVSRSSRKLFRAYFDSKKNWVHGYSWPFVIRAHFASTWNCKSSNNPKQPHMICPRYW